MLGLLGRSATGQPLTSYTSILSGPKRPGEVDGPEEFHVILLDAGRTKLLEDPEKRESLYCIRCGACLNHCPVYRKIGGHNYPWVYSGPIGKILTPQFKGLMTDPWLPFASSLCGVCAEVCPVKIDIPKVLLQLRSEIVADKKKTNQGALERMAFKAFAWAMRRPWIYEFGGTMGAGLLGNGARWISDLPFAPGPVKAWLSQRHLPAPASRSFREQWRARRSK